MNFSIFIFSPFNLISFFFLGKKNETHIKKPLNAFMLYMKEMRPVVQAECTLKESAAINQLLGRRVRQQVWIFFNLESLIPLFRLYVKVLFDAFNVYGVCLLFAICAPIFFKAELRNRLSLRNQNKSQKTYLSCSGTV